MPGPLRSVFSRIFLFIAILFVFQWPFVAQEQTRSRRNVIIFVADGLRAGSVNQQDAPTFLAIRKEGVNFANSHSLFPTFTTANASAIATGHGLGDTGDFSNAIWTGYPIFENGDFKLATGTPTPFLENDEVLADVANHYGGDYLNEPTLLVSSAAHGYNTASIGKLGPAAIQQIEAISAIHEQFRVSSSAIIVDDATGSPAGVPLPPAFSDRLLAAGLPTEAPTRNNGYGATSAWNNGYSGNYSQAGTRRSNVIQQQWFAEVATKAVLPQFIEDSGKPFVLLFWSRDPDGTQHNEGDSLGTLYPGINGDTARQGVHDADRNLRQIMDWLDAHPAQKANTDVFLTSDHGFATISRQEIDRSGTKTRSLSAKHGYVDANGKLDTPQGTLPNGFLAIDLALALKTNLFDPDRRSSDGTDVYKQIKLGPEIFEHPLFGNGLLAARVRKLDGNDAQVIVVANGGSDLIYVPDHNSEIVKRLVDLLAGFDYVGGVFVDDRYGQLPGALPLSAVGLVGSSPLPRPAIAVAFKVFYTDTNNLQSAAQISDTNLQEGQGMHGGFGRDSTFNNMAAIGPDFKTNFVDNAPVSNADIVPTLAHIIGIEMPAHGMLKGRVIDEALHGASDTIAFRADRLTSSDSGGHRTILYFQKIDGERYFDRACFESNGAQECP